MAKIIHIGRRILDGMCACFDCPHVSEPGYFYCLAHEIELEEFGCLGILA